MPSITNKAYDALLILLDDLVNGIQKHPSNRKIIATLNAKELKAIRQELEFLRNDYIQKENMARVSYASFKAKFILVQKRASNDIRIIKGILDPKANELLDFGIIPEKEKMSHKKKYAPHVVT